MGPYRPALRGQNPNSLPMPKGLLNWPPAGFFSSLARASAKAQIDWVMGVFGACSKSGHAVVADFAHRPVVVGQLPVNVPADCVAGFFQA